MDRVSWKNYNKKTNTPVKIKSKVIEFTKT